MKSAVAVAEQPQRAELPPEEDRIGVSQARRILGFKSSYSVHRLIADGKIDAWQITDGGKYILSRRQVEACIKKVQAPGQPTAGPRIMTHAEAMAALRAAKVIR